MQDTRKPVEAWWSETTGQLVKEKQRAYDIWLQRKDQESYDGYKQKRRELKAANKESRETWWAERCQEIERYIGGARCTEAWRLIKELKTQKRENGLNLVQPEAFVTHYRDLLTESRQDYLATNLDLGGYPTSSIDLDGVMSATKTLRSGRFGRSNL